MNINTKFSLLLLCVIFLNTSITTTNQSKPIYLKPKIEKVEKKNILDSCAKSSSRLLNTVKKIK